LELAQHTEVSGLARLARELLERRPAPPGEPVRSRVVAREPQARGAQPVALALLALLDPALVLERGEQSEDVVLVEVEPPGQLRHADLFVGLEHVEHARRIRDGLDRVLALRSMHRPALCKQPEPFRSARARWGEWRIASKSRKPVATLGTRLVARTVRKNPLEI